MYSTYLGGSDNDYGRGIAVDGSGHAYLTGGTESSDFPTQGPFQTDQPFVDAFVTKLSPSGGVRVYSTYLGGDHNEYGNDMAVDGSGHVYVTGVTGSSNFPTQGPYQTNQHLEDAFVTKLSPSGDVLVYSTYLGGNGMDGAYSIALDGAGHAYVAGGTDSGDFPTQGPYQTDQPDPDVFVTKLCILGIWLSSATGTNTQLACVNEAITPITYGTTGSTGATFSGLPTGVTGNYAGGSITISGMPTVTGTFNYIVTLTGGCGNVTAPGTINVQPSNTITLTSASGTDNQIVCFDNAIEPISYSTTGATGAIFSGLPDGLTSIFFWDGTIGILGTPTVRGTFNYTVTLTGGCGNVTATGTITVRNCPTSGLSAGGTQAPIWHLCPNPHRGEFFLRTDRAGTFELLDGIGRLLRVYELEAGEHEIREGLGAGIYYLREQQSGIVQKMLVIE